MEDSRSSWEVDDVHVWVDPAGGITIKTLDPHGDPVELSSTQARELAAALLAAANLDDAN